MEAAVEKHTRHDEHRSARSPFAAFSPAASQAPITPWQFWQSLPILSKLLVVFVIAQACLWTGYTIGSGARNATVCMGWE